MKAHRGSSGIAPHISNVGTRWKWVLSFTPRPPYPQERTPVRSKQEARWFFFLEKEFETRMLKPYPSDHTSYAILASWNWTRASRSSCNLTVTPTGSPVWKSVDICVPINEDEALRSVIQLHTKLCNVNGGRHWVKVKAVEMHDV